MIKLTNSCVVDEAHIIAINKYALVDAYKDSELVVYLSGGQELKFYGNRIKEVIRALKSFSRFHTLIADWNSD